MTTGGEKLFRAAAVFATVCAITFIAAVVLRAPRRTFAWCAQPPVEVTKSDWPAPMPDVVTLPLVATGRTIETSSQSGCEMTEDGRYVQELGSFRVLGTYFAYKGQLEGGSLAVQEIPACAGYTPVQVPHLATNPVLRLRRWPGDAPRGERYVLTSELLGSETPVFSFRQGPRGRRVVEAAFLSLVASAVVAAILAVMGVSRRRTPRQAATFVACAALVVALCAAWLILG